MAFWIGAREAGLAYEVRGRHKGVLRIPYGPLGGAHHGGGYQEGR